MDATTRRSERIFGGLILLLACFAAAGVYLPHGDFVPAEAVEPSAPRWVLACAAALGAMVVYGALGWIGLRLGRRLGWPELLDPSVSARRRWGHPAAAGIALGLLFILVDRVASTLHPLGPLPHPPFPTSLVASGAAAIGEETLFRLFLVPLGVWLVSEKLLRGAGRTGVFWAMAGFSALAFAASHLPALFVLYDLTGPADLPAALLAEILLLNGALSLAAAWHLRSAGFLAAAGVHLWADLVWHVAYGLL